jgi:hypothetical protein
MKEHLRRSWLKLNTSEIVLSNWVRCTACGNDWLGDPENPGNCHTTLADGHPAKCAPIPIRDIVVPAGLNDWLEAR